MTSSGEDELVNAFKKFVIADKEKTKMTSKELTKLFKDCKLNGKNLTSNATDIAFMKAKEKGKNTINKQQFEALIADKDVVGKYMQDHAKLDSEDAAKADMLKKIKKGEPAMHGTTKTSKTGGVAKMTDTSQYTGAHKERFGADGKGKGAEGRKDKTNDTGYVGAYKGDGTHGKKK